MPENEQYFYDTENHVSGGCGCSESKYDFMGGDKKSGKVAKRTAIVGGLVGILVVSLLKID